MRSDGAEGAGDAARRIALELDLRMSPVAGRLRAPSGEALDFAGYVELIAALERLRGRE